MAAGGMLESFDTHFISDNGSPLDNLRMLQETGCRFPPGRIYHWYVGCQLHPGEESSFRDNSVMQVQGNACSVEKDSLRAVIETEKAKSDNWEKSYNTVKKDNETCAQMLVTSIGMNEKKQEKEQEDRRAAAMATSSSFLGGVGIGLLIMWLIMK